MDQTSRIIVAARGLVSDDGENPEYDRAIVELSIELIGLSISDDKLVMAQILGVTGDSLAALRP